MKSLLPLFALPTLLALNACKPTPEVVHTPEEKPVEAPVADKHVEMSKPVPEAAKSSEDATAAMFTSAGEQVDIGGFGSDQPVERADLPSRGVLTFGPDAVKYDPREHWEQWDWKTFNAKRPGRYAVRLTYKMAANSLPTQFKFGTQALKEPLRAAAKPTKHYLGEIYIEKPGDYAFALFAPASGSTAKLEILELAFIPAPEGPLPVQAADGSILLEAKSAITWSETMRYEPKPEKNCLGYWTSEDDFAEWEFEVTKPGKFAVSVFYGCGGGNHGSEVALKLAGQEQKFTTEDTGGFQAWTEVKLGEFELKDAGKSRLSVDPITKAKGGVLDVQKVVLKRL